MQIRESDIVCIFSCAAFYAPKRDPRPRKRIKCVERDLTSFVSGKIEL